MNDSSDENEDFLNAIETHSKKLKSQGLTSLLDYKPGRRPILTKEEEKQLAQSSNSRVYGFNNDEGEIRAEKARNKNKSNKNIKDIIKDIKKDTTKKNIKKMIKDVSNTLAKKSKSSKTLNKAMELAFEIAINLKERNIMIWKTLNI